MIARVAASDRLEGKGAPAAAARCGVVVIGRNEGERLIRCFSSLAGMSTIVYVDSGSSDGSVAAADARGIAVMDLPTPPPFTAARARNAGARALISSHPEAEFIQTVDGDCEIDGAWIAAALSALATDPDLAAVFGRLKERHPDRSIYNAMCDDEWDVPVGDAAGFGGIAMIRLSALREAGFYRETMIAGEDSELAVRMRKCGWRIRRIDAPMATHDADITRFSQWWRRAVRSGHAYGEMASLHPDVRWPNWSRTRLSILIWGAAMPFLLAASIAAAPVLGGRCLAITALLLLLWVAKIGQIAVAKRRAGLAGRVAWGIAGLLMIGKMAQVRGLARFYLTRAAGRGSHIIEYKRTAQPPRAGARP